MLRAAVALSVAACSSQAATQNQDPIAKRHGTSVVSASPAAGAARSISGRVVDAAGDSVAGATVFAGKQLIGDRDSPSTGKAGSAVQRTETDAAGSFRLEQVGAGSRVVVADHPTLGRSMPATVHAPEGAAVTLTLRPVGRVSGRVTRNGAPVANVTVVVRPVRSERQTVTEQTGKDGRYAFSRLAKGDYVISAMLSSGQSSAATSETLAIAGGAKVERDLAIVDGNVTLTVRVSGKAGAKIDAAQLFLFSTRVQVTNARELSEAFKREVGDTRVAFVFGRKADFTNLHSGQYTLCTLPITGNLADPKFMERLQQAADQLDVYCELVAVGRSPTTQVFSVSVPAMSPLSSP